MAWATVLVAELTPVAAAFCLLCGLWRRGGLPGSHLTLKLSLAVGLGLGVSSCIFFLALVLFDAATFPLVPLDAAWVLIAVGTYVRMTVWHPKREEADRAHSAASRSAVSWLVAGCLGVAAASAIATFVAKSLASPHGGWDAWAIWNLRARFLFRAGGQWKDAFSGLLAWSHPDYPLLIPGAVARVWKYVGSDPETVPMTIALLFALATVGLACSSLTLLRSPTQGMLAGLCLLASPVFAEQAALQYADVPLGYFFLATFVLLACDRHFALPGSGFLFAAGTAAGFAAWTKNEGVLFLAAVVVVLTAEMLRGRRSAAGMVAFVLGALPIVALVGFLKLRLAPPGDLLSAQGWQVTWARLTSAARYWQVTKAFAAEAAQFGGGVTIVLAAYVLLVGKARGWSGGSPAASLLAVLALMVAGLFGIYIITPHDLTWQLSNSLMRLFVQLWPSAVFAALLIAATPEERGVVGSRVAGRPRKGYAP